LPWQVYLLLNTPAFTGCNNRTYRFPVSGLYGAFLVKGGRSTTFSFLLGFLGPFFCSTAPQAFFRPDRKMPKPTRAAAVKDGAFLPCRPKGLVLDGREDGGML
jgi:hypothetical protein